MVDSRAVDTGPNRLEHKGAAAPPLRRNKGTEENSLIKQANPTSKSKKVRHMPPLWFKAAPTLPRSAHVLVSRHNNPDALARKCMTALMRRAHGLPSKQKHAPA